MRHGTNEPVLVLGDGGWGTALATVLADAGRDVRVWSHDPEYARRVEEDRENPKFLPGIRIPDGIRFGSEVQALVGGVEVVFSVIPTQYLRRSLERLASELPENLLVVTCSKGFEKDTLEPPSGIVRDVLGDRSRVVVLSGPSHAEEVSKRLPTTVVVSSEDPADARRVQVLVGTPRFRAYTSPDPLGVEIAGATKNVIALGAGISDGLGFGDNARAGLVCRGAREIARLGAAMGARPETFSGLSGIGDLIATCTSSHSRNRAVGYRIAAGERLRDVLRSTEKVAEGVETTRSVWYLSKRLGVQLPITRQVYAVLFEGKPPRQAVEALMRRELKDE